MTGYGSIIPEHPAQDHPTVAATTLVLDSIPQPVRVENKLRNQVVTPNSFGGNRKERRAAFRQYKARLTAAKKAQERLQAQAEAQLKKIKALQARILEP